MKKTIKSLFAIAAAFAFTACSDVPEPAGYNPNTGDKVIEFNPTGSGTKDDPYTTADAIAYAKSLNQQESTDAVYIKGKVATVSEAFTTQYGNGTFTISDDGQDANVFTCYRVMYLGNKKYTGSDTQIQVGDDVIVYGKVVNYRGNTPETVQGTGYLYSLNGVSADSGEEGDDMAEAKGAGTLDDPFNVAAALAKCQEVGQTASAESYYIKGKVKAITEQFGTQYGNATFTMVDEGYSAVFTAYRVLYLGNKKYTSGTLLAENDEVVIYAQVVNFKGNTPETSGGYLYSLNGVTESSGGSATPTSVVEAKGSGTLDDPFNVAAIVSFVSSLPADVDTEQPYYVKGIVTEIPKDGVSTTYNNLTFYISDDKAGSNKFYIFRAKGLNGGDVTENMIKAGDEVVVFSNKWVNYKGNTPETKQGEAYIVSIIPGEGGEQGDDGDETATSLANGDFETWADGLPTGWKSASTASSATLTQSTDAHGGQYAVCVAGDASQNKRLASQEIRLAAGSYTFSFWVKATTSDAAQVRPGYVPIGSDGKVGTYMYGDYATLSTSWQQVSHEFTLEAETTVCLVVMNPKKSSYSSGKDVLVDDATLTKK